MILDEPFTGLDPVNTDLVIDEIIRLRDCGTTVIFSTHDMSTAEKMCDFIFMIFNGKKVLNGTLDSIQNMYGNDTLRIRCNASPAELQTIPGVEHITDYGQLKELRMNKDADPQRILTELVRMTTIQKFELAQPSLHEIFIRIAGPEAREAINA
mgnify:CR=1 FL=1